MEQRTGSKGRIVVARLAPKFLNVQSIARDGIVFVNLNLFSTVEAAQVFGADQLFHSAKICRGLKHPTP